MQYDANWIAFSGGLDSSILGQIKKDRDLNALTIIAKDFIGTDLSYSQIMGKHLGIPLELKYVSINEMLDAIKQKKKILKNLGIDFIIIKKFDKKFSKIKSYQFIKDILCKCLKAKYIFVSDNFRFGNKREGNVNQLIKNEKELKFKIVKPKPLVLKNKVISSTLIRNLLSNGKLEYANQLLSRKWSIESKVQKGRQMGKEIGFPTCNMDIKDYVIPKLGVYAVRIHQKNNRKILKGIANIGYRPTFNQKKILLEVYIFNFSGNLYNKYLTIEFINFIRKEKKFKNINQLKKQINSDLKLAKKKLN